MSSIGLEANDLANSRGSSSTTGLVCCMLLDQELFTSTVQGRTLRHGLERAPRTTATLQNAYPETPDNPYSHESWEASYGYQPR